MQIIARKLSFLYHQPKHIHTLKDLVDSVQNFDLISLLHHRISKGTSQTQIFFPALDFDPTKDQSNILKQIAKNGPTYSYLVLEWIGKVHRKTQKAIVDRTSYFDLMETYFSDIKTIKNAQFNFCNTFCYLEAPSVLSEIKKNQLSFINSLNQSHKLTSNQFQSLINPSFYNITDMPKIYQLLYQRYFPSINELKSLDELHQSLIYLTNFSKIPYFLPKKILTSIESSLQTNKQINCQLFTKITNMIYLLKFKFPVSLSQTGLSPSFEILHRQLTLRYLKGNKLETKTFQQIQNQYKSKPLQFLQTLKYTFKNQSNQKLKKQKQKLLSYIYTSNQFPIIHKKIYQNKNSSLIECLLKEKTLITQITENDFSILKTSFDNQIKIKINRVVLLSATMPLFASQLLFTYLKQQYVLQFYLQNTCLPDLLHSTQIALNFIQKNIGSAHNKNSYSYTLVNYLSKKIAEVPQKDLEQQAIKITQNPELTFKTTYIPNFQQFLWRQISLQQILFFYQPFNLSNQNIINLFKKDPRYLISLMKLNNRQYINEQQIQLAKKNTQNIQSSNCNYAEGLGLKIEQKTKKNQQHIYIFNSELTKNHSYFVPYANKKITKYYTLQGSLKQMMRQSYKFEKQ